MIRKVQKTWIYETGRLTKSAYISGKVRLCLRFLLRYRYGGQDAGQGGVQC